MLHSILTCIIQDYRKNDCWAVDQDLTQPLTLGFSYTGQQGR